MVSLYVLGFVAAVATARVLKSSILKSGRAPFLLEMPSYRWPTVQSLFASLTAGSGSQSSPLLSPVFVPLAVAMFALVVVVAPVALYFVLSDQAE